MIRDDKLTKIFYTSPTKKVLRKGKERRKSVLDGNHQNITTV
jgi:hypothetical protein